MDSEDEDEDDSEEMDGDILEMTEWYSSIKSFIGEHGKITTRVEKDHFVEACSEHEPEKRTWGKIRRKLVKSTLIDQYVRHQGLINGWTQEQTQQLGELIFYGFAQHFLGTKSVSFNGDFITAISGYHQNSETGLFELDSTRKKAKAIPVYPLDQIIDPNHKLSLTYDHPDYDKVWSKYAANALKRGGVKAESATEEG